MFSALSFGRIVRNLTSTRSQTMTRAGRCPAAYSRRPMLRPAFTEELESRRLFCTATQLAFVQQPTETTAGSAISPAVTVAVEDSHGNVVTSDNSTVTLTLSSGTFADSSTTETATAVAGVATFSGLTINVAGSYSLYASDGTLTPPSPPSFTVDPGAATQLVFVEQPTSGTAGSLLNDFEMAAEDSYGNIATGYSGGDVVITLSSNTFASGEATEDAGDMSSETTFHGVTQLIINIAGTYTFYATAAAGSATSSSFTINPSAASEGVFLQQPTNATAGATISPAIEVETVDNYGNVATGGSVTIALSSGTFADSNSTETVSTSGGVATFSSLVINAAGTYTLSVQYLSGSSSSFTISPGSATQVAFLQQPTDSYASTNLSPTVTVAVEDAYGNVVTGDSSTVTLTPSSGTLDSGDPFVSTSASSGIATFSSLSVDSSGYYNLVASDGSLASATSNSFTIS